VTYRRRGGRNSATVPAETLPGSLLPRFVMQAVIPDFATLNL